MLRSPHRIKKKLLLHVDVNQTIMMTCIGKSNAYVIQCELSQDEQYKYIWQEDLPEMTYHAYITKYKLDKNDKEFRDKTIAEIENFVQELKTRNNPFFNEIKKRYDTCLDKLNSQKNIVPSFYNLLNWLKTTNQEYKILIRTFGADGQTILKELHEHANLNFIRARFGYSLCLMSDLPENNQNNAEFGKIYLSEYGNYIVRDQENIVRSGFLKDISMDDIKKLSKGLNVPKLKADIMRDASKEGYIPESDADGQFILNISDGSKVDLRTNDLNEMYKCWIDTDQHLAIRDNYDRWSQHTQHWKYSKSFPFERDTKQNISIFFDDNIKTDHSTTNIVAPYDVNTKQFVEVSCALEEGYAHPIEPLKAIEDDNYFITLVKATLEKVTVKENINNNAMNDMLFKNPSKIFTPMLETKSVGVSSKYTNSISEETHKMITKIALK